MYWQILPTPSGCALFVDGRMFGSPSVPPPSGWLQRQYGITMPIEYEHARLSCQNGFAGHAEPHTYDECLAAVGVLNQVLPLSEILKAVPACRPVIEHALAEDVRGSWDDCPLSAPFAPGPPFRVGNCVWLEWEGWVNSPNNVPGAAGNMVLWSGQYDGLYDQPFVPHEHFLPNVYIQGYEEGRAGRLRGMNRPLERVVAGARATSPMDTRDCYFYTDKKGIWGCCQKTCRLLFGRPYA